MSDSSVARDVSAPKYLGSEIESLKRLDDVQIAALDAQLEIYRAYNDADLKSDLRDALLSGDKTLPVGTLLHGTRYDADVVTNIAKFGVMAGDLFGFPEDCETHYCADFFRVAEERTIADYCAWSGQGESGMARLYTRRSEGRYLPNPLSQAYVLGVIVDAQIPELRDLFAVDAYRSADDAVVNQIVGCLPVDRQSAKADRFSAILGAVPRSAIAGILVSEHLRTEPDRLAHLTTSFGNAIPVLSIAGDRLNS